MRPHIHRREKTLLTGVQGWLIFLAVLVALLSLDLGLFNRRAHAITLRQALGWSAFWVALGLGFGVAVYFLRGRAEGLEYFAAYIVEKSLSVDNLFVIAVIFNYFKVEPRYQHRVLFWGILGALLMRGVVIIAGVQVLTHFEWTEYLFGLFLIYTGIKMLRDEDDEDDFSPERNIFVRLARRMFPVTDHYRDSHFFVREPSPTGRTMLYATPMLIVLLVVESADLLFAVDSIPAVLAISRDPFVVLTSNIFAILGLRALYFVLAGVIDRFHYLKLAVCVILVFVGAKMLVGKTSFAVSTPVSLAVIVGVLTTAAVFSIWHERRHPTSAPEEGEDEVPEHAAPVSLEPPEEYAGP